jgi:hypothetical protein
MIYKLKTKMSRGKGHLILKFIKNNLRTLKKRLIIDPAYVL